MPEPFLMLRRSACKDPPSTLRARFHDLIARRRAAASADGDAFSVAETDTSNRGIVVLSGGVVLFAAIALFGFLIDRIPIAIAGLAATALCLSSLARILDRPRPSAQDEITRDDSQT